MGLRNSDNIKAGFKACGIFPLDPDAVLKKLPAEDQEASTSTSRSTPTPPKKFISEALLEYLQQFRYNPDRNQEKTAPKKKRLSHEPGKSISEKEDFRSESTKAQSGKRKK